MKHSTIIHINISTHMKGIEIETAITKIGTRLIQISQIKFTLKVQMVDFTN
jgi:hypothetical protein